MLKRAGAKTELFFVVGSGKIGDEMNVLTYKKRTPPREKYASVESGVFMKVVPIMIACKTKVLCTTSKLSMLLEKGITHIVDKA